MKNKIDKSTDEQLRHLAKEFVKFYVQLMEYHKEKKGSKDGKLK